MEVDLSTLIAIVASIFAIFSGVLAIKRNNKKDTSEESAQITTVIVKLENIQTDLAEIKADNRDVKKTVADHSITLAQLTQRIVALEKNVFQQHSKEGNHNEN